MIKKKQLVSLCIFCYNQQAYIADAVKSALEQKYSPLEIIVSDDCSTDKSYQVIKDVVSAYSGPHKIIVNRNETNVGLGEHFNIVCSRIAQGDFIILLGGDDISLPNHTQTAVSVLENEENISMADFTAYKINSSGKNIGEYKLKYEKKYYSLNDYLNLKVIGSFAPGRIIRSHLVKDFPPIFSKCPTEDSVLVLRSLITGGFVRYNSTLLHYRKHESSLSGKNQMKKISHFNIIAQLKKDIIHCYERGIITEEQTKHLLKRVEFEYRVRRLKYQINNSSLIARIKIKLYLRLSKFMYFKMQYI